MSCPAPTLSDRARRAAIRLELFTGFDLACELDVDQKVAAAYCQRLERQGLIRRQGETSPLKGGPGRRAILWRYLGPSLPSRIATLLRSCGGSARRAWVIRQLTARGPWTVAEIEDARTDVAATDPRGVTWVLLSKTGRPRREASRQRETAAPRRSLACQACGLPIGVRRADEPPLCLRCGAREAA